MLVELKAACRPRVLLSSVPVEGLTVSVEAIQRGRDVLADDLDGNCCVSFFLFSDGCERGCEQ